MPPLKVAITDYEYEDVQREHEILESAGIQVFDYQCKTEDELIEATRDKDGVIVQYANMTRRVIEQLEHCHIIIKYGIGVDNIDQEAATERGIYVCNVPDYGVEEVANHTMAFLLCLAKGMVTQNQEFSRGSWGYSAVKPLIRLSTCTLGLIGFGRIPQMVCKRALSFGLRVLVYDPYVSAESVREANAELVTLDTLLEQSDYVSCHCPLTAETRHCIDRTAISKMKPTACIINTARGGIICEADLIEALQNGQLAGAALDVFEHEPLSADSPLRTMPNVLATGHTAWYSEGALNALQTSVAQEVRRVLLGEPPKNAVNRCGLQAI